MNGYIAITDRDWFEFLKSKKASEAIFWRHSKKPHYLDEGTLFFFLVKKEGFVYREKPRMIEGFGVVQEIGSERVSDLWNEFGEKMGEQDLKSLVESLNKGNYSTFKDQVIGYYRLKDVKFLGEPLEPEYTDAGETGTHTDYFAGVPFKRNIVTGKKIDEVESENLLEKILELQ